MEPETDDYFSIEWGGFQLLRMPSFVAGLLLGSLLGGFLVWIF